MLKKKIKISLGIGGKTKGKLKKHYKNSFEYGLSNRGVEQIDWL
jgi:hypothetical protein